MKLFLILVAITSAHAASFDRVYLQPNAQSSQPEFNTPEAQVTGAYASNINAQDANTQESYNQNAQDGYPGYSGRPERPQAALERNAAILRQDNSNDGETYSYAYETENGIYAEENGVATNGVQAQGRYSYTGDDGKLYSVRYTADENGFQPQGDHLPTPPPIPEEILRSLEQNARDEAAGIYDDGSYREANNLPTAAIEKAYLPPSARGNSRNDDRRGYQY